MVATALDEGFESINNQFSKLGNHVGMLTQQVIAHFTKQFACTNSPNDWNIYRKYVAANKPHELARLLDFEKEILTTFEEAKVIGKVDKTVAQCQQLFHKTAKRFVQSFSAMAKSHGCEGALIMARSVVNQDGGLGFTFTTAEAENFFAECCHADIDEIIGHFKVHI
ncbi:hypothetical protein PAXRUDRAFT_35731 [Paxillus rubicundulus Ve08.2h10]|uniref:Uncharacterized protein n=1 Tax=Paxillus rubicundulus Ve08.2h10 TaxID=930991 RepID=A0A0D0DJU4_9AGAM|nr:hypothetical protein PAXRUDRAFT_35731 [Paxillus rubicundulus Ve08.2h10]